jgi:hypothetical protein
MHDRNGCVASRVQEAKSGFTRPAPRRVPIGDKRGISAQPQLLILAASLLLWTVISTTATLVFS